MEKTSLSHLLPSYKKPPINEVVCGVRFSPPSNLSIPHIGLLWDKFRDGYPTVQHAPPIATDKGELLIDETTGLPFPRVWFINESKDQLIQFQFDRLYFNWRRRVTDYPRYKYVIKNFEEVFDTSVSFFDENEIGELKPIELELSYINHIPKGEGWDTIKDLSRVFTDFVWKQSKDRFLPVPENVTWHTEFPLPDDKGRLIVKLKQATRTKDKVPLLYFELKAKGNSKSSKKEFIREWFDLAHEWIVRGFTDLTTPENHEIWEREENV